MHCALLMANEDVPELFRLKERMLEHRIVDRQDCPAWVAEDVSHALVSECLDDHFSATDFFDHGLSFLSLFSPLRTAQKKKAPGGAPLRLLGFSTYACAEDPAPWARTTTT